MLRLTQLALGTLVILAAASLSAVDAAEAADGSTRSGGRGRVAELSDGPPSIWVRGKRYVWGTGGCGLLPEWTRQMLRFAIRMGNRVTPRYTPLPGRSRCLRGLTVHLRSRSSNGARAATSRPKSKQVPLPKVDWASMAK